MRGELSSDVYQFDTIPKPLRIQVIYIFEDFFSRICGSSPYYYLKDLEDYEYTASPSPLIIYGRVCSVLIREYGLIDERNNTSSDQFAEKIFFETQDTERAVSVIEMLFQHIKNVQIFYCGEEDYEPLGEPYLIGLMEECTARIETAKKEAFDELNIRFQEHGVGYSV